VSEASLQPDGEGRWLLAGPLDFTTVPEVWPALERALTGAAELTVSLAGVERANSAALALLIEARDLAQRSGCSLRLVDLPDELLDLAGVSQCETLIGANAA
jgi:phospholipid transport system transporter-binding protein